VVAARRATEEEEIGPSKRRLDVKEQLEKMEELCKFV
jgi:hypothetical protein